MMERIPKPTKPEGTGDRIGEGETKMYDLPHAGDRFYGEGRSEEEWKDFLHHFVMTASENQFDIYVSKHGRAGDVLITGDVRGDELAVTRLWNNGPSAIIENESGECFKAWITDYKLHLEKI